MLLKPLKYRRVPGYGLLKLNRRLNDDPIDCCEICMYRNFSKCGRFPCYIFDIDLFTYVPIDVIKEVQDI